MGTFRQFPYSNFHEMNMDEIIKIIKNMLEEWAQYHAEWDAWKNQMNDDWSNYQEVMNEAWQNMQDFINNYFDNLDVQNEINNKIISMVHTGEFASIVKPYIPTQVTSWLSAHITQPVGVVIDTSLSVAGACADAKATGDSIGAIATVTFSPNMLNPTSIITGKYISTNEDNSIKYVDNANYSCTLFPVEQGKTYTVTASNYYVIGFTASQHKFVNLIDSPDPTHPATFTVNSASVKYAGISWRSDVYSNDKYQIVEGASLPKYMPYGSKSVSYTTESIEDLSPRVISALAEVTDSPNLLDPMNIVSGKFITTNNDNSIKYTDNADYSCTLFPVEQGKTYTVTASNYYVIGFTASQHKFVNLIDSTDPTYPATFTVNSALVKYAGISWRRDVTADNAFMIVEGFTLPEYTPYGAKAVNYTPESIADITAQLAGNNYYVGEPPYNNTTRFQYLFDCLSAVASASGEKTIHIKSGTYDLYTEMGGRTFIESKNINDNTPYDSDVQPWITDTKIIGEGKVVINFKLPNDIPHDNYWLFSALNVKGNFELENVQIFAENCRYAIHDESKTLYPNTIRKYKNCVISHRRTDSSINSQTMGCGFSERTRCEYKDLILINNNGLVWSCHANAGTSLEFDNVVFRNEAVTSEVQAKVMRISNNGMYQVPIRAILSNCFIGNGTLIMREENYDNRDSNTRVDLINTHIGNLDFQYTTNIYEPVTSYDTISGEVNVLVTPNA